MFHLLRSYTIKNMVCGKDEGVTIFNILQLNSLEHLQYQFSGSGELILDETL